VSIAVRVAEIIIEALELEDYTPEAFPTSTILFAPAEAGGLDLDSVASLEIIACLADEFDLPFDDVTREDLTSVDTLAAYIEKRGAGAPS